MTSERRSVSIPSVMGELAGACQLVDVAAVNDATVPGGPARRRAPVAPSRRGRAVPLLFDAEETRAAEATFNGLRDMPEAPATLVSVDVCEIVGQA